MSIVSTLTSLAVVAATAVAAAALNPTPEQHRARIKTAVTERSPIAGMLGLGSLAALTTAYHSVGVASYTVFNDRTVSIGAFGTVFIVQ
jgi:hypothetical protein